MKQLPEGAYNFTQTEAEILKFWLEGSFYKPEYNPGSNVVQSVEEMKADPRQAFSIILPPPNAYGRPHLGNISGYAYQDAMGRYARQQGKKVLLLPGKDHAGLEGEGVFIRDVLEKEGSDKFALGREEFYKRIWEFNQQNMALALKDEKNIGLSADFDRNLFTLDPRIVETVLTTFVDMYKKNMIYRGTRIINWDPKARSTIADNQCERKEKEGEMWYLRYKIVQENTDEVSPETLSNTGDQDYIVVATARPETIWADVAVAVNPEDERYKHLIGRHVLIPGTECPIPVISSHRVLTDFGTGCLKITPAHALDDFTIMQEWNAANPDKQIGYINVISKDLTLVGPVPEKYKGRKYKQIKEELAVDLTSLGLLEKREKIMQNALVSERTGAVVEPMISSQWFVAVEQFKQPVMEMVRSGKVRIHPDNMEAKFHYWMENLRDWAISRSLWWGYRLPVWYAGPIEERIDDNGQVQLMINLSATNPSNASVKIIPATPEDATPIFNIGVDGWHDNFVNESVGITLEKLENEFGKRHNNLSEIEKVSQSIAEGSTRYWVAKNDSSEVVGWVCVENADNEDTKWLDIYVARAYRSQGVGSQLMNKVLSELGHIQLDLAVPENSHAYRFYEKYGFKEYSRNSENVYGLPIIQMRRSAKSLFVPLDMSNPEHVRVQLQNPGEGWYQDPDVLDTWFSSGQWPYATLKVFNLMDTFYPTDVMETGYDILENWVSRMMMFSWFNHGVEPFKNVYLHGLVLGSDGQKMSKSRRNMIDVDEAQAQYGVDAIRMVYFYQNKAGASYSFTHEKLKTFRNFNNKIWNATKFVLGNVEGLSDSEISKAKNFDGFEKLLKSRDLKLTEADTQMLAVLKQQEADYHQQFQDFRFGLATEGLYGTFWHDLCDIYIEAAKPQLANAEQKTATQYILLYTLRSYLKMLHPFIPHITEAIWQHIRTEEDAKSLMYEVWE